MLHRVCLVSVQVGAVADEICSSSLANSVEFSLSSCNEMPADFYVTASVLTGCDLLITNDTSVAHLAGALGIPAWLLLKAHPSWQWGDDGMSTPWYESIQCFRQHRPFCWEGVLRDVDRELAAKFLL
jgi:ADP-heptose:LPS heptosyltransferase